MQYNTPLLVAGLIMPELSFSSNSILGTVCPQILGLRVPQSTLSAAGDRLLEYATVAFSSRATIPQHYPCATQHYLPLAPKLVSAFGHAVRLLKHTVA